MNIENSRVGVTGNSFKRGSNGFIGYGFNVMVIRMTLEPSKIKQNRNQ